jgi:hypothetical protein
VSLVQINTPLFAYEPILRGLQAMRPIEFLRDGALLSKPHKPQTADGTFSDIDQVSIHKLVHKLEMTSNSTKKITLDNAQAEALIWGLTQKVALIQGPPGIHLPLSFGFPSDLITPYRNREILHWGSARQSIPPDVRP